VAMSRSSIGAVATAPYGHRTTKTSCAPREAWTFYSPPLRAVGPSRARLVGVLADDRDVSN
jgi:hypothetical protein